MINFKNLKIFTAVLTGLLIAGNIAQSAEIKNAPEKLTYKFRMLKDKISALSVKNSEEPEQTKIVTASTTENVIIKKVDGITVISNNPVNAPADKVFFKNRCGRPDVWVEDRVRFEENSYKTNGGNFNKSAVINRMRLNLKMNLGKKTTMNFSGNKNNHYGNIPDRNDEPVTHGNVIIDLDK